MFTGKYYGYYFYIEMLKYLYKIFQDVYKYSV